jgi:hypothetical protein
MIKAGLPSDVIADLRGMKINKHYMDYNGAVFNAVTKEPETTALNKAFNALMPEFGTGGQVDPNAVNKFAELMAKVSSPEYQETISKTREIAIAAKEAAKSSIALVSQLQQVGTAAAGGVASAATNQQPPAAPKPVAESLNRLQLNELFGITGNKIDASKLQKTWEKAGSPTDSEEVAKILQGAGVDPAVISQAYTDMSLPAPAGAEAAVSSVNTKDLLAQIMKLAPTEQKQVLAYLKK